MTRITVTLGLTLVLAAVGAPAVVPAQGQAEIDLRRAIETETVEGDREKALEQYGKLAGGSDRNVAVQALLRMARVYELRGDAEARKVYERVIAQFPDQKDAVEKARVQLRASTATPTALAHHRVWDVMPGPLRQDFDATEGSVSSDGRYICFTAGFEEGGTWHSYLAVHDVIAGTDRILTKAPKADSGEGCSFSPSGDQVAYTWHGGFDDPTWELRVVGLDENATPRTLLTDDTRWFGTPAWSPDGRSIAVQAVTGNERTGRSEAVLVSVLDGSTRTLASPGGWRMFFSPDGRSLALDRRPAGSTRQRDVFVLSMERNEEINVTEFPSDDIVMGWSPDSSRVLFASDRGGSGGLYAVSMAPGTLQPTFLRAGIGPEASAMGVTGSGALHYHATSGGASWFVETVQCDPDSGRCAPPVPLGPADRRVLSWSPDGRYLAYLSADTSRTPALLAIRSMESGAVRAVPGAEGASAVSWAPDSRTLAIGSLTQRLYLVDAERAQVTELARRLGALSGHAWSNDQRTLYYRRELTAAGGGDDAVVLIARDLESGAEREVLRRPRSAPFDTWALSRDGQSIWAMVTDTTTQISELITLPVAGGEPRVVARRPRMGGVNLSPDGRYVATGSRDAAAKATAVLLIPTEGGEPRELARATDPSEVGYVIWAPDSRSVYFRRRDSTPDSLSRLWRVGIDGGEARRVEGMVETDIRVPMRLSPDGRQFAFIRGDGRALEPRREVWKLEHFLPAAAPQR